MDTNSKDKLKSDMVRQIADFFADKYQAEFEFANCGGSGCCSAATDCGNDMSDCGCGF